MMTERHVDVDVIHMILLVAVVLKARSFGCKVRAVC
jgi:hypothetical protein